MYSSDDQRIHLCYSCDAEFTIDPITEEDDPVYCPFCGAELDPDDDDDDDLDEEFDFDE